MRYSPSERMKLFDELPYEIRAAISNSDHDVDQDKLQLIYARLKHGDCAHTIAADIVARDQERTKVFNEQMQKMMKKRLI